VEDDEDYGAEYANPSPGPQGFGTDPLKVDDDF